MIFYYCISIQVLLLHQSSFQDSSHNGFLLSYSLAISFVYRHILMIAVAAVVAAVVETE